MKKVIVLVMWISKNLVILLVEELILWLEHVVRKNLDPLFCFEKLKYDFFSTSDLKYNFN